MPRACEVLPVHARQDADPTCVLYVLRAHGSQREAFAVCSRSHKQSASESEPGSERAFAGHRVHAASPTVALYESAAQGSHAPASLEKPGAHSQSASDVLSAGETWPGGQCTIRAPANPTDDEAVV